MSDSLQPEESFDSLESDDQVDALEFRVHLAGDPSLARQQTVPTNYWFRPPGPGLPEALLWTIGVMVAQLTASLIVSVSLVVLHLLQGETFRTINDIGNFLKQQLVTITGFSLFLFVLMVMFAAFLRLGGMKAKRRLALVAMPPNHIVLIFLVVVPLSMLTGQLHMLVNNAWQFLLDQIPSLALFDQMEQQEMLKPLAEGASFPTLLLIIAVSPAISEELVFRGVIGRGLLARWGAVGGILITSVLFALLHMHPAIVVALMPLAVLLHLLYLATRSFFAPMLLHFLNNAWAAMAMKFSEELQVEGLADEKPIPALLLLSALFCVVPICIYIGRTRVRHILPNGEEWSPGYVTAEQPPSHVEAVTLQDRAPVGLKLFTVFALLQFITVFIVMTVQSMPAE